MNSEDKFWSILWVVLAVVVIFGFGCVTYYNVVIGKAYIENSYEQTMDVGNRDSLWKKVK